jgi:SRSO17 transposase
MPPIRRGLIDRRVCLPRSWTHDQERCAAAGIPASVGFAANPELALDMITGAVTTGTTAARVASDELYGDNGAFRAEVAKLGLVRQRHFVMGRVRWRICAGSGCGGRGLGGAGARWTSAGRG